MTPQEIAQTTARILIETKAVHFNPSKPYIFTSGWASPTYIDCRKLISFPRARQKLMDMAVETIERDVGFAAVDAVAGGETAGIPFAAWIADRLSAPMLYVRKKPKGFARNALIEGDVRPGSRVLLVEDLATDGKSKLHFIKGLRDAGCEVTDTFVLFHYGIFPETKESLGGAGVKLHALATWWHVLELAEAGKYFSAGDLAEVRRFLEHPADWSAAHGGAASPQAAKAGG
ncbi:MAG: orotate phosphoribosyltransferase [Alphaproteobacteria bacterium]|nr:orotate phosphoribosyltransferase [Alphaproteobacteria bacterium]